MTDTQPQTLSTPHASSLQDLEPLLPAELTVLRAAARGDIAKLGYRRPRSPTPDVRLRAAFLSILARGVDDDAPVARRHLQIMGGCVTGRLDLTGANLPMSLWFYRCSFGAAPVLASARVHGSLSFVDCALPGLRAEGVGIDGEFALRAGCTVDGQIELGRARVGGDVDLRGGVESVGDVRFVGARVGGDLHAGGARMTADIDDAGVRGIALNLDRAQVGGHVALDAGFSAAGTVRLVRARIGGDLDCRGAAFDTVGDASWGACGSALRLDGARIAGALILQDLLEPLQGASLVDTRVGTLTDDAGSWGRDHVLDGFAYRRFGAGAPTDAPSRLDWLLRQNAAHLDPDPRPDPWRRAIRVLRRNGHGPSATALAVGRARHRRRVGLVGRSAPAALRWLVRLGHDAWGLAAGYGHRPARLFVIAAVVWLFGGAAYWASAERGGFAPVAERSAPAPTFQPFAYSLDALLPLAALRQAQHWVPARNTRWADATAWTGAPPLQWLVWVEAACGWALALAGLAAVWARQDRDG